MSNPQVIVQPKKYTREDAKAQVDIPLSRGTDTFSRVLQWPLAKWQSHAVAPFETNEASRGQNTSRR